MSDRTKDRVYDSYNAGYVQDLYESYVRDPRSVDERWAAIFGMDPEEAGLIPVDGGAGAPSRAHLRAAIAAAELVDAYRLHGHTAARLDPLGGETRGHPMLSLDYHGIAARDLDAIPASLLGLGAAGTTMREVLDWLRETYTGTIGYEFEHLEDPNRREWLRRRIEAGEHRRPLSAEEKVRLLRRLTEVAALEQFLHRAYLGQKRFSIEGNDMLVPVLDLAIERAAGAGAREVVLGMAHRGRLNVLAHVLGQPYEKIIREFEGQQHGSGTGDVKYHLGAEGTYATESGDPLTVTMAPNPSHLEFVNPVVEGIARAKQTDRDGTAITQDVSRVLPVLMHGDAAFAGQGIVAETLNLARLKGWETGGTLHIIVNNQIGFTTDPEEARSTDYASDLARGFDIPVFHVNADDAEACLSVVRLALAYRTEFQADVLIDLVGYRRYGHNEGDEPAYTQPRMYDRVDDHPTARELWAERLKEDGTLPGDEIDAIWNSAYDRLGEIQQQVKEEIAESEQENGPLPVEPTTLEPPIGTAVDRDRLIALDRQLHSWPDDFAINPKLERQLKKRAEALESDEPNIDWAHAEALAFASLLAESTPIRLTGQDSARGTFSQRHLTLRDIVTGQGHTPLRHLDEAAAPFEVYNSPLSEAGVLGFEYGYSTAAARSLVLWEAQFGDFVNGAEVIIDQFLVAGRAKWAQTSRLVLLLPHGYEGQGPEHSSARIERFLQLAAEDNIRVANCTTPDQYFHLLRRQARLEEQRPLIVFTPKSLLRHPKAVSGLAALTDGEFRLVIDDPRDADRAGDVRRVVLCSGKVYYDLLGSDQWDESDVAVIRVEQLYPFPADALRSALDRYGSASEIVWVQEEPANMGAWSYVRSWLQRLAGDRGVGYVGRPERASPAEGYKKAHDEQQARIVREAFGSGVSLPGATVTMKESETSAPE